MKYGVHLGLVVGAFIYVALIAPTFLTAPAPKALVIVFDNGAYQIGLPATKTITVEGPLGATIITASGMRARITASPCPNKICVKCGWLTAAGDTAVCLPNRVALRLE